MLLSRWQQGDRDGATVGGLGGSKGLLDKDHMAVEVKGRGWRPGFAALDLGQCPPASFRFWAFALDCGVLAGRTRAARGVDSGLGGPAAGEQPRTGVWLFYLLSCPCEGFVLKPPLK